MTKPQKCDIWLADLDPQIGTEAGKTRPVLVIQTDGLNGFHPSTIVCPVTTNTKEGASMIRVHLAKGEGGLMQASDILIDQLRAIDNRRFKKKLGTITNAQYDLVKSNIIIILDL